MPHLLSLMSTFGVVARERSFTRAAERLGLSKSVVSRHVSALEGEVGAQLLYRSTHGLALTEAGERFLAHCAELERVATKASSFQATRPGEPRGTLRVTLPQTLVMSPVGALLTRFHDRYPAIDLDVQVTSLQIDPVEEGFDVALRLGDLPDSALLCRKIRDVRLRAVATPGYLKRYGTPKTIEDLAAHRMLVYSEFASRTRRGGSAKRGDTGPAVLRTNSAVLLLDALHAGQGILVGPEIMFEAGLKRGKLRPLLQQASLGVAGLYAVFPPGRLPSPNRQVFVDFLVDALRA